MTRCDYDTIFQRVFCVTLVAIALTFTVILTNVFVDIDGLLSSKDKLNTYDVPVPVLESEIHQVKVSNLIRPDTFYKEDKNYDEDNDENYRSKRSLETPNFLFHIKNPKLKSILTNRLTSLLEELDGEENIQERRNENDDSTKAIEKLKAQEKLSNLELQAAIKDNGHSKDLAEKRDEEDFLHLAMHNILLQGIIGHMDLNDVYRKVHSLLKSFKEVDDRDMPKSNIENLAHEEEKALDKEPLTNHLENPSVRFPKIPKEIKRVHNPSVEENKFFEEMIKCDKLQDDITNANQIKTTIGPNGRLVTQKAPKLLIKTIIDITSSNKDKARKEANTNSKETIKGIIKLIYNGKSIKFSRMEDEENHGKQKKHDKPPPDEVTIKDFDEKLNEETKDVDITEHLKSMTKKSHRKNTNAYFKKIVDDYFKKYPKRIDVDVDDRYNEKFETKRLKRHIKIRYEPEALTTPNPKPKIKINDENDDDELFVEIETHFDSKGMKGEKKKKLVRSLINKIQKAIHSDIDKFKDGKKHKHKHLQVKKRIQNPLEKDKKLLKNKIMLPFDKVEQRHSDPISKAMTLHSPLLEVADQTGDSWKKPYSGPRFLTVSKSLNSAEMGEIDVDYNKIIPINDIPQRLQKPLNTDISEEVTDANTFFDLGKLKFYIKNIDGTGLSIGFNQYTDEAPDPDTIKLFTGIEHLVKKYHQNEGTGRATEAAQDKTSISDEKEHQLSRDKFSNRKEHVMIRRSIKETRENDYHSNEYKIIFDNNYLPYNNYQEIFQDNKKRVALTINKETENINTYDRSSDNVEIIRNNIEIKEMPALLDENVFYKKLKPSEILSIASLLDRQKRSPNMHRITNLKRKMRLNRYLNTRPMGSKKIFLNKKRSKRQIDKIRIIATDSLSKPRHSDDNIFFVNDENLFADRAIIREVETPEVVDLDDKLGEQYDMEPAAYEEPIYPKHMFEGRSRQNQLMSKYPHIFMEEVTKSKEEMEPIIVGKLEIKPGNQYFYRNNDFTTEKYATIADDQIPKLEDLVKAIDPNQNVKVTVKILPKNLTASGVNHGFKEIHASINKSFNKDGLRYSSLVNVTEVSKIENIHNTTEPKTKHPTATVIKHIQDQQNRMDKLLKQHKQKINEQLDHLTRERDNLDLNFKTTDDHVTEKDVTTIKPDPLPQVNDYDISKLLALLQLQTKNECPSTTLTSTSTTTTTTSTTTTTTTSTTTTPKPTTTEPTVSYTTTTDNINSEILNQINKNTEMLQKFLQKLSDKLSRDKEPLRHRSEEIHPAKFDFIQRYWKPFPERADLYQPPPPPQMPFDARNNTQLPMPFVYAYPPPYPYNSLKHQHIPIASVVYHGHIHTDSLKRLKNAKPKPRETPKTAEEKNQTRYFIDDLDDFKVEPVKKNKKDVMAVKLVMNTTATV